MKYWKFGPSKKFFCVAEKKCIFIQRKIVFSNLWNRGYQFYTDNSKHILKKYIKNHAIAKFKFHFSGPTSFLTHHCVKRYKLKLDLNGTKRCCQIAVPPLTLWSVIFPWPQIWTHYLYLKISIAIIPKNLASKMQYFWHFFVNFSKDLEVTELLLILWNFFEAD